MPRRTRSQLLSKRVQQEHDRRVEQLEELARQLRARWSHRRRRAGTPE